MPYGYLPLTRQLSLAGDGTGTSSIIADYSTPDNFYISSAARTLTDDLNEDLDASETDVDVDAGTEWIAGDIAQIDDERMLVTGISTNTLTVVRGVQGTTATTHSNGANIIKASRDIVVDRIVMFMECNGTITAAGFGKQAGALSNGLLLTLQDSSGGVLGDLTPTAITKNGHWSAYCFDIDRNTWGSGNEWISARWSFDKYTPDGLVLTDGMALVCTAQDNFSHIDLGIVDFTITAEGYYLDTYSSVSSTGLI